MSLPTDIPQSQARNNAGLAHHGPHEGSPTSRFLVPSPIITRRTRTKSVSEKAKETKRERGKVKSFCRNAGHGFIVPENSKVEPLFVHISDIEGEYVPKEGDTVEYHSHTIPPKNEKLQALHVRIINLAPGVTHEKWDSPSPVSISPSTSPRKF